MTWSTRGSKPASKDLRNTGLFEEFCEQASLSVPKPNQYELTYVNHVTTEGSWSWPGDMGEVFPDVTWRGDREYLGAPARMSWSAVFDMEEKAGRLHASVKSAKRKMDNADVLVFELIARGFPMVGSDKRPEEWLQRARGWIVKGFADLTSEKVQYEVWGRKR